MFLSIVSFIESIKDANGKVLVGHHNKQEYHRKKGAFIILLPEDVHKTSQRAQHPFGTKKGAGLTPAERADWVKLRPNFNKEWGLTVLIQRKVSVSEMLELGIGKRILQSRGLL